MGYVWTFGFLISVCTKAGYPIRVEILWRVRVGTEIGADAGFGRLKEG